MKHLLVTVALIVGITYTLQAQETTRKKHFNTEDGIAIKGYDPVAYFTQHKAVKGKKEINVASQGITYCFATPENKALFTKSPTQYEPQYGGWCAYAMGAKGEKVPVDPATFKIVDNKLYLFYNQFFNNTLKDWNKDEAHLKTNADANWGKTFRP